MDTAGLLPEDLGRLGSCGAAFSSSQSSARAPLKARAAAGRADGCAAAPFAPPMRCGAVSFRPFLLCLVVVGSHRAFRSRSASTSRRPRPWRRGRLNLGRLRRAPVFQLLSDGLTTPQRPSRPDYVFILDACGFPCPGVSSSLTPAGPAVSPCAPTTRSGLTMALEAPLNGRLSVRRPEACHGDLSSPALRQASWARCLRLADGPPMRPHALLVAPSTFFIISSLIRLARSPAIIADDHHRDLRRRMRGALLRIAREPPRQAGLRRRFLHPGAAGGGRGAPLLPSLIPADHRPGIARRPRRVLMASAPRSSPASAVGSPSSRIRSLARRRSACTLRQSLRPGTGMVARTCASSSSASSFCLHRKRDNQRAPVTRASRFRQPFELLGRG